MTASNKGITCCFDNRIAILAAIVIGITTLYEHRSKGGTSNESPLSNGRYTMGDCNRGKGGAKHESYISNARNAIGDDDGGEGGAAIKSRNSNTRDAIGDCCILTTNNKGIGSGFDDSIAIPATVVGGITAFHYYSNEGGARSKSTISNTRDAIRDGEGNQRRA